MKYTSDINMVIFNFFNIVDKRIRIPDQNIFKNFFNVIVLSY